MSIGFNPFSDLNILNPESYQKFIDNNDWWEQKINQKTASELNDELNNKIDQYNGRRIRQLKALDVAIHAPIKEMMKGASLLFLCAIVIGTCYGIGFNTQNGIATETLFGTGTIVGSVLFFYGALAFTRGRDIKQIHESGKLTKEQINAIKDHFRKQLESDLSMAESLQPIHGVEKEKIDAFISNARKLLEMYPAKMGMLHVVDGSKNS